MKRAQSDAMMSLKINSQLRAWFKDYCDRQGKGMSQMLKEYIEGLRRKDERAKRNTQEANP